VSVPSQEGERSLCVRPVPSQEGERSLCVRPVPSQEGERSLCVRPVPSQEGERSLCVRGIHFSSIYDFSIGFWKCSESVVYFVFHSEGYK
jgi:hypothetical protein